jgi:formate-dependent nitrite reductase membrane component NrfD
MTISATKNMNHNRKTAWSGKVLIPMWTIQIAAILATIIGYIWFIANYTREAYVYNYDDISWKK